MFFLIILIVGQSTFLQETKTTADIMEAVHNIPAEIITAQAILESGWGKSKLAKKHNYFGIKNGNKGWQKFGSRLECFDYHARLLTNERYGHLVGCSVEEWAYGLRDAGYCPEQDYPERLLRVVNMIKD